MARRLPLLVAALLVFLSLGACNKKTHQVQAPANILTQARL